MTLDESGFSDVDPSLAKELEAAAYGSDNRPVWIGSRRPQTSHPELESMAGWAATHYDFYLNFVREYVEPDGLALDIGCGTGQNTAMLSRYCRFATGIDKDPKAIAFARKYNGEAIFILGDLVTLDIPNCRDYIFLIETIEHIPHDKQFDFLGRALSLLKPGGLLFLTTPNEETSSPPHIGIWSPGWMKKIEEHFPTNIVRNGFFSNLNPAAGFVTDATTHRALVMKR